MSDNAALVLEIVALSGTQWLALACFEACLASPMSISDAVTVL